MRIVHNMKDLAMIYGDYEWDKARVVVWQPDEQRNMELTFCGSTRPGVKGTDDPGEINFIAKYKDNLGDNCVISAFRNVLGQIIGSSFDMSKDWEKEFIKQIVELRK